MIAEVMVRGAGAAPRIRCAPGSKGGVAGESGATVPLIANDVENLLTSSLLGAFVDRVQLGVNLEGESIGG